MELGYLSANYDEKAFKSIQITDSTKFLNLNCESSVSKSDSTVLIYYKICKELSKSADFSNQFSTFPLKQVRIICKNCVYYVILR